jgi:tight adherence protein B
MWGELNLLVAFAIFVGSVAVVTGLGLFVISLVLRARARHRKRLARVGRRRLSGVIDMEEARLLLLRRKEEANALVALTGALARVLPILDRGRLTANIRRSYLKLSVTSFMLVALALGVVLAGGAAFATGAPFALVVVPGLLAGMVLTDAFVRFRGQMMSERFMKQLPEVLDTIIRGIRAGLPVQECIANVGKEVEDPVGGHFRAIAERVQLGEPLDLALWRAAKVVDRPEMDFFAISISIQQETGGSLSEALGNLAKLLRDREKMKLKIRAISSEARASAMIIGALPFAMLALLSVMSPDYVAPLFTDSRGNFMLLAGLASISMGAFVMWRMTKFEI